MNALESEESSKLVTSNDDKEVLVVLSYKTDIHFFRKRRKQANSSFLLPICKFALHECKTKKKEYTKINKVILN